MEQCTGVKDKNGVKIYEGDKVEYERYGTRYIGIVRFGIWVQDVGVGEYGIKCLGFYIERLEEIIEDWEDEDDDEDDVEYKDLDINISLFEVDWVEVKDE